MSGPNSLSGCSRLILNELAVMWKLVRPRLAYLAPRTSVFNSRYSCSELDWLVAHAVLAPSTPEDFTCSSGLFGFVLEGLGGVVF